MPEGKLQDEFWKALNRKEPNGMSAQQARCDGMERGPAGSQAPVSEPHGNVVDQRR